MAKGRTTALPPRVNSAPDTFKRLTTHAVRLSGSRLQKIRFAMWKDNPHCNDCKKLTQYPYGFNIDHKVPLEQGGQDNEHNRQLLCIECHDLKSKAETKQRHGKG